MISHADFHFLSSKIWAKFLASPLHGQNVFKVFRTLTLILLWKRRKLSKAFSGNFMRICGRSASFFSFNTTSNLEQVCDNSIYFCCILRGLISSTNINSMISLGRLVITLLSIFISISICLSFKLVSSESKYGFKRETLYLVLWFGLVFHLYLF